jgi:hypothetical protein
MIATLNPPTRRPRPVAAPSPPTPEDAVQFATGLADRLETLSRREAAPVERPSDRPTLARAPYDLD